MSVLLASIVLLGSGVVTSTRADCVDVQEYLRWTGGSDTPGRSYDVEIRGNVAYVADQFWIRTYDLTGLPLLREIGEINASAEMIELTDGSLAVAAYSNAGVGTLTTLDVTDPATPVVLGRLDGGSIEGLAVGSGLVCLAGSSPDFRIVDIGDPSNPQLIAQVNVPGNIGWLTEWRRDRSSWAARDCPC